MGVSINIKRFCLWLLCCVAVLQAGAQQQPLYSQYMMDAFLVNPAVAGAEGVTAFNLTARKQWAGYGEGPSTFAISGQHRVLKTSHRHRSRLIKSHIRRRRPSGRTGLGGFIFNDNNGRIHRTGMQGTYSYHIQLDRELQLSLGASIAFFQFRANVNSEDGEMLNDPLLISKTSKFAPDANVGILISSSEFYAGLSVTSLFQSSIQFGNNTNTETAYRLLRQYYLVGGYRYSPRGSNLAVEPSLLFTITERFQYAVDFNVKGYYLEDYWAGVSIKSSGAGAAVFGLKYQNYYFGYAFDYPFNGATGLSKFGSHEVMIGVKFGDSMRRYRWLNRF